MEIPMYLDIKHISSIMVRERTSERYQHQLGSSGERGDRTNIKEGVTDTNTI